ncbi:MAG: ribosomal RNA small subunit methyltransferase A [Alphaproteobacteria bacterium 40-19]|mgnify:CR=1 FL=1|nr:MAG: ribosomal RNA small subunit methyltransferase A [Alphaproteobacteria bacterium 40-19]
MTIGQGNSPSPKITPNKALGQNFLQDPRILQRLKEKIQLFACDYSFVLEIGPGMGALTKVLNPLFPHYHGLEKDTRFQEALSTLPIQVVWGDALREDWKTHSPCKTGMILGNLPYNISVPILLRWIHEYRATFPLALFMFQKEVGQRILAKPGSKDYGRLSILAQSTSRPSWVLDVPAGCFWPKPQIDSCVIQFQALAEPFPFALSPGLNLEHPDPEPSTSPGTDLGLELEILEEVVKHAFGQRRKMLKSSLKNFGARNLLNLEEWLKSAGISHQQRAETVTVGQYIQLAFSIKDFLIQGLSTQGARHVELS